MVQRGRRHRSQATLEFAFVAPLFLICFLATVDAGLWAVQNSAEVSAVQQAARLAAAAGSSPTAATAPGAADVVKAITPHLSQALFATRIVAWNQPSCPASATDVERAFGPRVVALCVQQHNPPPCVTPPPGVAPPYPLYCNDTPTVTVTLIGHVASLVPPGITFAGTGGELVTNVTATTHILRFAP